MSDQSLLQKYDNLLMDTGPAAIVLKHPLMPVEGAEAVIFPPTYAAPKGDGDQRPRYNLDALEGNQAIACAIDSIGSQANRVEPLFKREKYKHLVPQILVMHGGGSTNLLDAGHRIADAIIRFSELLVEIHNGFMAYGDGNPEPMAKLAPTSLVFGAWDSRGTQIKIPRLINLRIDANDVEKRTRSAQYVPATDYVGNGLIDEVDDSTGSDLGFAAVPASGQLGGVHVRGDIVRTGSVNLATLQSLGNGSEPTDLQRYILGLALVSLTAFENSAFTLRQGCQLVGHPDKPRTFTTVLASGENVDFAITPADALGFATKAAGTFGVGIARTVAFDSVLANRIRDLWTTEATRERLKAIAKLRPLTATELDRFEFGEKNPLQAVLEAVKRVKGSKKEPGKLPPKAKRGEPTVVSHDALLEIATAIDGLLIDDTVDNDVKTWCSQIKQLINSDADSHKTLKDIETRLKEFKRAPELAIAKAEDVVTPDGEDK
ncbi:MAG: type I-U CRISPR-associated RAMP protein Csb1/Cas7u [Acidobacteriota bacterium]